MTWTAPGGFCRQSAPHRDKPIDTNHAQGLHRYPPSLVVGVSLVLGAAAGAATMAALLVAAGRW